MKKSEWIGNQSDGSGAQKRSVQYQKETWNPGEQNDTEVRKRDIEIKGGSWNPNESSDTEVRKRDIEMKDSRWNPGESPDTDIGKNNRIETKTVTWNPSEFSDSSIEKSFPELNTKSWAKGESSDTDVEKRSASFKPIQWERSRQETDVSVEKATPKQGSKEWGALKGLQPPKPIRMFKGVNRMSMFSIREEYATHNSNVTSMRFPAMQVRPGMNTIGDHTGKVLGISVWKGKEVHVISGGNWHRYNLLTGAWTQLYTGLSTNRLWSFVNFRGNFNDINLIGSNGVDEILRYDGNTVQPLSGGPVNGDFITTHSNRLYTSVADTVRISALRKAEDWSTINDSAEIIVETSDGKHITGLVAGPGKLVVFKENSIHELFGTSPSNYQMRPVTEKIGTQAGKTAVMLNGVLYFLGNDGVYRYSGGSLPVADFSLPIQRYIDEINTDWIHRSVAGTDGKKYYLAIPHKTATDPNLVLEYDPTYESWNVWEYTSPLTAGFVNVEGSTYGGNADGKVFEVEGNDDDGAAIEWEWTTKPFTFDSMAAKSRWYRLWLVADVPVGSTLSVHLSDKEDGENWSQVKTINSDENVQSQQLLIPVNQVFNSNWMRVKLEGSGPATVYELTRQERVFQLGQ